MYELIIQNEKTVYIPAVVEDITWTTERGFSPGKLDFKLVSDKDLNIEEGNPVRLKKDGHNVFYGFIFTIKENKKGILTITAYDQLRYFKNKDTYVYENKTASEFLKMIIDDFHLNAGDIEDTKFKIESRIEDNTTLFDMVKNALNMTLDNSKELYVLFDDFGKINLKNLQNMKLDLLLDDETGEDYDYTSSIDKDTYNKIKIVEENKEKSKREVYIAQSGENINKWGILQKFDKLKKGENGKSKADALLSLYNKKSKHLVLKKQFGDIRVRGGSLVIVNLHVGSLNIKNYMLVQKVTHKFKKDEHFMDLTLIGGDFIA